MKIVFVPTEIKAGVDYEGSPPVEMVVWVGEREVEMTFSLPEEGADEAVLHTVSYKPTVSAAAKRTVAAALEAISQEYRLMVDAECVFGLVTLLTAALE